MRQECVKAAARRGGGGCEGVKMMEKVVREPGVEKIPQWRTLALVPHLEV